MAAAKAFVRERRLPAAPVLFVSADFHWALSEFELAEPAEAAEPERRINWVRHWEPPGLERDLSAEPVDAADWEH